jgi:hypothetical protein
MNFTPKFKVQLIRVKSGFSKTNAIQDLANVSNLTLAQAKYIVDNLPQPLCVGACEVFRSVIVTDDELRIARTHLVKFDYEISAAEDNVLSYGACITPPWQKQSPVAVG